jgi:phosphatidylglycerophosphate synthase
VDAVALTEGERWTRERLEELRGAGFTPLAICRFLLAARRRASEQRLARPTLARQARSWTALGALAWLALAAAGRGPFRRRLRSGLTSWGLTGLMLDWHLGMVETEDGRPRRLGAADACTLLRAWLVPVAAEAPSPLVCALAFATDGLDGSLARATGSTRLGRDLEGVVDAAFAAAALRGAARRRSLGRAAVAVEAARLAGGSLYVLVFYGLAAAPPDRDVAGAGRFATPIRATGMIAAGLGRRRAAETLVWAAAATSAAAAVRARIRTTSRASVLTRKSGELR